MYDWKALAPTRPLTIAEIGDDGLYVKRAREGALRMDALLDAGLDQPIAVVGPAGAGKSTELAALAKRREEKWVGALVRLDKELPYSEATDVEDVMRAIATTAARHAIDELRLNLSQGVAMSVRNPHVPGVLSGVDLVLALVRELRAASKQGEVGLLIDGLEKASVGLATRTVAELERLRGEAHVVVVVPTALATGPDAAALESYHVLSVGPVSVVNGSPSDGWAFLSEVASRRLGVSRHDIDSATAATMHRCMVLSGGLIRTFLQLVQKSALYAAMRGREAPEDEDVTQAARDQTAFLLRLLKEGDVAALRSASGTSGINVEVARRVRFLANGLLLEYTVNASPVVYVAPLLADAIRNA